MVATVGCAAPPTAASTTTAAATATSAATSTASSPPSHALPAAAVPVVAAPAAAPVVAAPVVAAPAVAAPAVAAPAVAAAVVPSPAAATSASAVPASPDATTDPVPYFTTPDDAMRYLAAAYNSGDETAIWHVTTPDSRTQFEAERQWVKTFRFRDCLANGAPTWDYACVLDIVATVPGVDPSSNLSVDPATGLPVMDEVTVLVAPAARTGYYLAANEGCGGG